MLDENLPTFVNKISAETPNLQVIFLTQNGEDPKAEYMIKRPDPALREARNRYAVGLVDSIAQDAIYAEVLIDPQWTQPSLSAADIRANGGVSPPQLPIVPDSFTIQLYNPDQTVVVKLNPGSWNSRDSWDFELPELTFRVPSNSQVDQSKNSSGLTPKIMFRWKKDSRLGKDMTCFMTGKSLGGHKKKDPDITVAFYKQRRSGTTTVTMYEPNMQRVEVEDRKGLDIVLLLSAEVIKDLYIHPRPDTFNIYGAQPKNVKPGPTGVGTSLTRPAVAISDSNKSKNNQHNTATSPIIPAPSRNDPRRQREIEQETQRLRGIVEKEERERRKEEERRQAKVDRETERLKKLYGVEGQGASEAPQLPLRRKPVPEGVGPTQSMPGAFPVKDQPQNHHSQHHNVHPQQHQQQQSWATPYIPTVGAPPGPKSNETPPTSLPTTLLNVLTGQGKSSSNSSNQTGSSPLNNLASLPIVGRLASGVNGALGVKDNRKPTPKRSLYF